VKHDRVRMQTEEGGYWGITRGMALLLCICILALQFGCEVDSYFDPSRTGRFMHTPTTIPILERIDVVEGDIHPWGETSDVTPDDLLPSDLTYVIVPGDVLTVEIYESFALEQLRPLVRRVDAAGYFRIPDIGDIPAAGLTPQELEDLIRDRMQQIVVDPYVNVMVEDGTAFTFTLEGYIASPGMYRIRHPDFRLSEAMAIAGGLPMPAKRVYVIRRIALTEEVLPEYQRDRRPDRQDIPQPRRMPPVDIEDLIDELPDEPRTSPGAMSSGMGTSPRHRAVPVDIDDLEPVRVPREAGVDVDDAVELHERERREAARELYIYDQERREWVRTLTQPRRERDLIPRNGRWVDAPTRVDDEPPLLIERIIEIPAESIRKGIGRYDLVIRPKDRIVVEGPQLGTIYITGEVGRPGVYNLPQDGGRLTLSRAIAAAGDLGGLAIPERVDLVRKVGPNREATVRLDLAAIRRRTEPDIYLKPDDHIFIGTSWFALPLAVIRNGFRSTYGFGFLLDRNFGNDVFGAPPLNRGGGF
jgi:polysaccharide biosynthesis/export protein